MNDEQYELSAAWQRMHAILWKHMNQEELTEAEQAQLAEWLSESDANIKLYEELSNNDSIYRELVQIHKAEQEKTEMREKALFGMNYERPVRFWTTWTRIAAAVLIFLLGAALFYYYKPTKQDVVTHSPQPTFDIAPGKEKAILQLADGRQIVLDDVQNGVIANEGQAQVKKMNGALRYEAHDTKPGAAVAYNTITTPRGGQYQVMLEDGSKVHLNAGSSLRFPSVFTGNKREVTLTGEAYFEVVKDSKAFVVRLPAPNGEIEVMGTVFNVNSYANEEAALTTLVEGRIRYGNNTQSVILQPGQQAASMADQPIRVNNVDVALATAWKNGYFQFSSSDIQSVFRQLERWYDIDVVYEGSIPEDRFSGKIQRNLPLLKVMKYLEKSQIKYRLEGKKLIVMN